MKTTHTPPPGKLRIGAPISRFHEATERLKESARENNSLTGLHPYDPSTPKEKVLADTHECEELVSKYNSDPNSKYRIEATQDMVSRASSRADFSRSLQRDSLTALKNSQQEKRTKNLINGSLLAVGAAGAMFLSPGLGRTLTLIAGVGGLTGTILTNRADSFINQEIDRWDTYHQRTLKEGAEAEHLAESTMAWHRFLTPPD